MSSRGIQLTISTSRSIFDAGFKVQAPILTPNSNPTSSLLLPIESKRTSLFIHEKNDTESVDSCTDDRTSCSDECQGRYDDQYTRIRRVTWKTRNAAKVEYESVDESEVGDSASAFVHRIRSCNEHESVDRVIVYTQEAHFVVDNADTFQLSQ